MLMVGSDCEVIGVTIGSAALQLVRQLIGHSSELANQSSRTVFVAFSRMFTTLYWLVEYEIRRRRFLRIRRLPNGPDRRFPIPLLQPEILARFANGWPNPLSRLSNKLRP